MISAPKCKKVINMEWIKIRRRSWRQSPAQRTLFDSISQSALCRRITSSRFDKADAIDILLLSPETFECIFNRLNLFIIILLSLLHLSSCISCHRLSSNTHTHTHGLYQVHKNRNKDDSRIMLILYASNYDVATQFQRGRIPILPNTAPSSLLIIKHLIFPYGFISNSNQFIRLIGI